MTAKAKTPKPKAKQYIRATVEGRVSPSGVYLQLNNENAIPIDSIKGFEVIESPAETVDLPTKIGTVVLLDPENKHNMLSACIRIKKDEYGNCWSNYDDVYTDDELAEDCIRHGYKVVQ